MKKILLKSLLSLSALLGGLSASQGIAQAATFTIDPTYTFLHTYKDRTTYNGITTNASDTLALSLENLGIKAGDFIKLNPFGGFDTTVLESGMQFRSDLIGVFSASNTLLAHSELKRVKDAIALNPGDVQYQYNPSHWTSRTLFDPNFQPGSTYASEREAYMCGGDLSNPNRTCGQETFFDGIFAIWEPIEIQVPTAAKFLFLAANDVFFSDNQGQIGIEIERVNSSKQEKNVPEPGTLFGIAIASSLTLILKQKRLTKTDA